MARSARFKKQHKAIGFGDPYDPQSVEGHRNAVNEAIETRQYNKTIKKLEAERDSAKPLHIKMYGWLRKLIRST